MSATTPKKAGVDAGPTTATPYRWRWVVLAVVLCAEIMDLLDATIVNLAATAIRRDIGGGESTVQWVVGAYTLAFAVALVLGGRLGDRYGRKNLFVIGAIGFTLASVVCATAPDPTVLILARAVQGFLGALLIPQGLGIIKQVFPPQELGKAFASFGPVIGLSAVAGPLLGGVLVDADILGLGWRVIFFINIPLGIAAVAGAIRFVPESPADRSLRIDPRGVGLLAAASLLLIYPLVQGHDLGWPWWTFVLMAASVPVFALFVRGERRTTAPLVEPSLMRNRAYTSGLGVIALGFSALIGFTLVFNVYVQTILGFSPLRAAFAGSALALGMAVAAGVGGAVLVPKYGRAVLTAGFGVMTVGFGLLAVTVQLGGVTAEAWQFLPAGFVFGLGSGLAIPPLFSIVLAGVRDHEVGSASGVLTALQQLGGTIGVAMAGTLFFQLLPERGPVTAMQWTLALRALLVLGALAMARRLPAEARAEELAL